MKIEYDPIRDLLYVYFTEQSVKVARTETIAPGIHIDFDVDGRIVGIEALDAQQIIGSGIEFKLPAVVHQA
ncbi:MAG: DUF2283 domain-containing protein [bacterium]